VSQYDYRFSGYMGLIRNIVYLMIVFGLTFYTNKYIYYLYCNFMISLFLLVALSYRINRVYPDYSFTSLIQLKPTSGIYQRYIIPYGSPLTVSSILTYVKNHLPIIILGKEFALEDVAVFSILKTFYKALHSISGSFIAPMMSKFLKLKNNIEDFSKKMNAIFYGALFIRLSSFFILSFLLKYLFLVYKIENNEINQFIFYVLGLEYVIAGIIASYGIVLRLDKTTNKVLITSVVRFIVELTLIYLILLDYGIMAAALILLLARYVETVVSYFFIRQQKIFYMTGLLLFSFVFPIAYFLFKLSIPFD